MKKLIKLLKCKLSLHKWVKGFGWSYPKRFDVCLNCNKTKWVYDNEGSIKLQNHLQWLEENKINLNREDKINKILNG